MTTAAHAGPTARPTDVVPSAFPERLGTGLFPFDEAVAAGAIEPGVLPLVRALNVPGRCSTAASCEGHGRAAGFFRRGYLEQRPFVLFRADIALARGIAQALGHGHGTGWELNYCWQLYGYFYPSDDELAWVIKTDDVRLPDNWDHKRINQDFISLAKIVNGLMGNAD